MVQYRGFGQAPGTCGELVQGFLSDGTNFHITLPIDLYSTMRVKMTPSSAWDFGGIPTKYTKIRQAIQLTSALKDNQLYHVEVEHNTSIPIGKGMASSTSDIISAVRATGDALNIDVSLEQQAKIAASIESSDGLMYPGLVAFRHKDGELVEQFQWYPHFTIVIFMPHQTITTDKVNFTGKDKLSAHYDNILPSLRDASSTRTGETFASAATTSSKLNQRYNPNPYFEQMHRIAMEHQADGVAIGHTGTVLGCLFVTPNGENIAVKQKAESLAQRLSEEYAGEGDILVVSSPVLDYPS